MGQGHDSSQWPVATVVTNRDFTGMAHSAELADLPLRVEVLMTVLRILYSQVTVIPALTYPLLFSHVHNLMHRGPVLIL